MTNFIILIFAFLYFVFMFWEFFKDLKEDNYLLDDLKRMNDKVHRLEKENSDLREDIKIYKDIIDCWCIKEVKDDE